MDEKNGFPPEPDTPLTLDETNFEAALTTYNVLVVDFWAPWCMPCRMVAPAVETLAKKMKGQAAFGKVNVDEAGNLAARFNVMSIPTLIIFSKGAKVGELVGAMPPQVMENKILAALKT